MPQDCAEELVAGTPRTGWETKNFLRNPRFGCRINCMKTILNFSVVENAWRCAGVTKWIRVVLLAAIVLHGVAYGADAKESPFVVQGKITDFAGSPLEGVEVNASCGMGSLFRTGATKSGPDGRYRLVFRPGISVGNTKLGVGTQVATISPRLKGWYEIHLGRRGNLMMTEYKDKLASEDMKGYSGVVAANEPYELNFTMAKAAAIEGRFVNEFGTAITGVSIDLTGDILPPSCSILAAATTDDQGRFTFESVPVWLADPSIRFKWRFTMRPFGVRHELSSSSFEVSEKSDAIQKVTLESTGDQDEVRLSLKRQLVDREK